MENVNDLSEWIKYFSAWHYESDGEGSQKTNYAVRDDITKPCGVDRKDFKSAKEAQKFVKESNVLIFRLLNT